MNKLSYQNPTRLVRIFFLLVFLVSACSSAPGAAAPAQEAVPPTRVVQEPTGLPPTEVAAPPTATAVPAPTQVPVEPTASNFRTSEVDQMDQIFIPEGEFFMGSDDKDAKLTVEGGRAYPEIPMHTVYLDSFWIDKFEVTNGQYALCVDAGVCKKPNYVRSYTREHYYDNPEFANYPVLYVDWFMANQYCQWAGRRLPSEAEWEKAARGNDKRKYAWGNEKVDGTRANFCDINCPKRHANPNYNDGSADTAAVGSYPAGASFYGVMDMSGNAWEWTTSKPRPYPYVATDGREDYDTNNERVWRGGPWSNGDWWTRATLRYRSVPTYWYGNLGFRCVATE